MDAIELVRQGFEHVHRALREDMGEVQPEWLFWQPEPGLNHIGFLFWHLVRDEDVVVSHVTKERELWQMGAWHGRFGMDERAQGTGLAAGHLEHFRYDMAGFIEYAEEVWARTPAALSTLTETDLDPPAWPGSDWNVGQQLVEGSLCHCWVHLGEIRYIMGLRGWRFRE